MKKIFVAILLATALFSCKKDNLTVLPVIGAPADNTLPAYNGIPATITLDPTKKGYKISETFEGMSYETALLTNHPDYLNADNTTLIQLIKNLGPGILRIGGNTSDEVYWTGKPRTATTARDSISTSDIDRLSDFSRAIGWKVIFGLNLGTDDAATAAKEAVYVKNSLGSNLYAFQTGNEPDVFHIPHGKRPASYRYNDFQDEWDKYFAAVRAELPDAPFAGPDAAFNKDWVKWFAQNRGNTIKQLDAHHYNCGPATDASITYKNLLAVNTQLPVYLEVLNRESGKNHITYRISECNSVWGSGKFGTSNTFAASLWALDFMWTVAAHHGQGVNFHNLTWGAYSPIAIENGAYTARPGYYAMLAFRYGNHAARLIPATLNSFQYNVTAYACENADNTYSLTIINKEEAKNFSFTVQLNNKVTSIVVARLRAPSITATTGVSFANAKVNADGTFEPGVINERAVNAKTFLVNVSAGSAAVVTIK